jgi:hypothetical protein
MTQYYAVYLKATGQIVRAVVVGDGAPVPGSVPPTDEPDFGALEMSAAEFEFWALRYVTGDPPAIAPRPPSPVKGAKDGDTITLSDVPIGSMITVVGANNYIAKAEDASGIVVLPFHGPGRYNLHVESFPALEYRATFDIP